MQIRAAGMAWFAEDDYEAFRLVLPDRSWHQTFALWRHAAEKPLKHIESQGIVAVKAHVKSDAFVGWCRSTGRNVDTQALTAFANEVAARGLEDKKAH
jgi:hypothetical protein